MTLYEGMLSNLDIFTRPLINRNVISNKTTSFQPIAPLSDGLQIEYYIAGTSNYVDLSKINLKIRGKIVHNDGTDVSDAEKKVSLTNLPLASLFSQVEAFLMTTPCQSANNLYPYQAYLSTLLNYGPAAKNSQLTAQGFYQDNPSDPTEAFAKNNTDNGIQNRAELVAKSNVFEFMGPLHLDISKLEKFLINDVDLKIRLIRAPSEFSIISTEANKIYKIKLLEATLYVRHLEINPDILLAHAQVMQKIPAFYPITQTIMKNFVIMSGSTDVVRENLYLGTIPSRIVLGLVKSRAVNGTFDTNPFKFEDFNLKYFQITINNQNYPDYPYTPQFKSTSPKQYVREYLALFQALDIDNANSGNMISYKHYIDGSVLFPLDLTREHLSSAPHTSVPKTGSLRLTLKFDGALAENVTAILFAEFESSILISQEREVIYST